MPSLKRSACKGIRILITSGPTSVPIDDMRVITNRSTGEMGRLLAQAFAGRQARVTMLEGAVTCGLPLPNGVRVRKFYFYDELALLLKEELRRGYDVIVHAAAVADFAPDGRFKGKLDSGRKLKLNLVPVKKLISDIKKLSPAGILVGFKFETNIASKDVRSKADRLFDDYSCDLVVLNKNDSAGYQAVVLSADKSATKLVNSKKSLVKLLLEQLGL